MNGAKISDGSPQPRPPACGAALKMEGEAELSRKNWLEYGYLSAILVCPLISYASLLLDISESVAKLLTKVSVKWMD